MKVLVTGAHGLLGRALLQADWGGDVELAGCGRSDEPVDGVACHAVDLTAAGDVLRLWRQLRPQRVIHTAAVTSVDGCETDPELARRVNRDAVGFVVDASLDVGAHVGHLSTDYVFDGTSGPYAETDEVNPLSVYGRMKLESEELVLDADAGYVVRTLWLYGHLRGVRPNLVTWPIGALAEGESLRIVDDQWGNPTYVHDLARALSELSQRDAEGLFHLGGTTFLTRDDLVRRVARRFGLDASGVTTMTTADAGQAAPRPLRSGLRTEKIEQLLGWSPASLDEGLDRLAADPVFQQDFGGLLPTT